MILFFQSQDNKRADTGCPVFFLLNSSQRAWGQTTKYQRWKVEILLVDCFSLPWGQGGSLTRWDLDSSSLWYCMPYSSTIRQFIVTPTESQAEQYSTCFNTQVTAQLSFMFLLNLSRIKFISKWMSLLFTCLLCSWTGVTTENRGVTAKLVMLAGWGRRHGCYHYLLPCNFPTSCFLDRNRKKPNCWILPLRLWCRGLVGWWRTFGAC